MANRFSLLLSSTLGLVACGGSTDTAATKDGATGAVGDLATMIVGGGGDQGSTGQDDLGGGTSDMPITDGSMAKSAWTGPPLYMAVGYDGIRAMSSDGVTFSTTAKGGTEGDGANQDDQYNFRSVHYANGRFVAVGGGCLPPYSTCPSRLEVMKSDMTWTVVWSPTNNDNNWIGGVASDGTHWVGVGGIGPTVYSADGDNWTFVKANEGKPGGLRAVTYGGGLFVAVGDGGARTYSADGQTWTITDDGTHGENGFTSVAYGGGHFAAAGKNGQLSCSSDGKTWTSPGTFPSEVDGIAYGGGTFLVNVNGKAYASANCTTWPWTTTSEQNGPGTVVHNTMVGGVSTFYGLSWTNNISTSAKGTAWTKATLSTAHNSALNQVASTYDE